MAILQSTSITGSLEVTGSGTLLDLSSTTGSATILLNAIENGQDSIIELTEVDKIHGGFVRYDSLNFYIGTKDTNTYTNHIKFSRSGEGITLLQNALLNTEKTFTIDVDNETTYTPFLLRDENSLYPIFSLTNTGNPSNVIQLVSTGSATFVGANNLTGNYALKVTDDSNNSLLAVANDGIVEVGTSSYKLTVDGNISKFGNTFRIDQSSGNRVLYLTNFSIVDTAYGLNIQAVGIGLISNTINLGGGNDKTININKGGSSETSIPNDNGVEMLFKPGQQGHIPQYAILRGTDTAPQPIPLYIFGGANTNTTYTSAQTGSVILQYIPNVGARGNVGIGIESPTERLHVSGNLKIDGLVTGSLTVASSGSTVLDIQGSQGQLFSVVDSFSGSLFKVATISGAPVIEAFSDNTVNIGAFNNEAIVVSGSHTTLKDTVVSGSVVVSGSINGNLIYQGTQPNANFTSVGISTSNQILAAGGINIYNNVGVGHNPFIGFKSDGTNIQVWSSTTIANFGGVGGSTGTVFNLSGGFFNPPSGTSDKRYFTITPSIARGASYSGNVYGLYIAPSFNPTDSGSGEFYSAFFGGGNVGVNTTTPSARLHIKAPNNLDDNYALKVTDNSDNDILTVENVGKVGINTATPAYTMELGNAGAQLAINGSADNSGHIFLKNSAGEYTANAIGTNGYNTTYSTRSSRSHTFYFGGLGNSKLFNMGDNGSGTLIMGPQGFTNAEFRSVTLFQGVANLAGPTIFSDGSGIYEGVIINRSNRSNGYSPEGRILQVQATGSERFNITREGDTWTMGYMSASAFFGSVTDITPTNQTASLDCSLSNFFTLTLSSSADTLLTATNIQPGQSINLRITQPATSGSLSYGSEFKFPNGLPYEVSATSSVEDIVSFIAFDSNTLYGSSLKNFV